MQVSCEKCGHRFNSQASTGIVKCPSCSAGVRLASKKAGRQEMPTMMQKITREQLEELQEPEPAPEPQPARPSSKRKETPACPKGHALPAPGALCGACEGKRKLMLVVAVLAALAVGGAVVLLLLK